jgi:hypothetical protein
MRTPYNAMPGQLQTRYSKQPKTAQNHTPMLHTAVTKPCSQSSIMSSTASRNEGVLEEDVTREKILVFAYSCWSWSESVDVFKSSIFTITRRGKVDDLSDRVDLSVCLSFREHIEVGDVTIDPFLELDEIVERTSIAGRSIDSPGLGNTGAFASLLFQSHSSLSIATAWSSHYNKGVQLGNQTRDLVQSRDLEL